ncbi:sigma-70 family RNA polymerase sigma factor family protein [Microbacterium pygmaeum]|uniref:hypothetical protein n=1 Tax=Microbacterium pygmaeum TaxID=370764 RepID=UPI000B84E805|nr:hypothetical protein [Microbacterium pygmaeum]
MTWWRNSSRHSDPQAKADQQVRLRETVRALIAGCRQRDTALIARLLTADVDAVVDTGGAVPSASHQADGVVAVPDLILAILARYAGVTLEERAVNGEPGILLRDDHAVVGVVMVGSKQDAIAHIWIVLNPAKIARFDVE